MARSGRTGGALRIGIIGAGVMGADHAAIFTGGVAGAQLVAIADADAARAQAAGSAAGARVFTDGWALIADKDVDAVLVAAPDGLHRPLVLACLAEGKPVLCEKPLAPTTMECHEILAAEQALGRRLVQVGFMRRFDPFFEDLRATLASGLIGAPVLAHCAHRNASAPGFFTGGMSISNSAVHEFDGLRWLLADEITNITVLAPSSPRAGELPDPLMILLRTTRGVLADVEVFMNARYGYDIRTEIVCREGAAQLGRPQPPVIAMAGQQGAAHPPDWRGRFNEAYRRQAQAWVESIRFGRPCGASAWDGLVATLIAEAGLRALEIGVSVPIDLPPRPDFYA